MEALATSPNGTRSLFATILKYWVPVLVYITLIVVVSAQSNLAPPARFRNADKLAHIAEYLVLGLLLARATHASFRLREPLWPALIALAIGVAVGSGDEFFQSFIPGRDSNLLDLMADSIGVTLAQVVFLLRPGR